MLAARAHGTQECLASTGLPLAIMEDATYEETGTPIHQGDSLLLFSDGAVEVNNAAGEMLGVEGLVAILKEQGYPEAAIRMDALEEAPLKYSNAIRLEDDLTLIEVRFGEC